jgi:2-methylcitrate dehydratase PrpD
MTASITQQLAEWIVGAKYEDLPPISAQRVGERFIDSLGVQCAGMSVTTGQIMTDWVRSQGGAPEATVLGGGFKTTAALATLANATAGHALEFDDIATFSGHYANPLTAAALAVGEKLGASGKDVIVAWMVGWEVIRQTSIPCMDGPRNTLLWRGWFNQGFQPTLGVAALSANLMGFDVGQTRMALANAASAMGGVMKNRGSDTKSFTAGNAAMHGVMAAQLAARGFTGNLDILDGNDGAIRLMGLEVGDPDKVLFGLGEWDMATKGSTLRLHASCGAGHWSQDALQRIVRRNPIEHEQIESIVAYLPAFLMDMMPYHSPQTGLEGKYSLEYDLAAIALDGRAGMKQYTDEAVQRPEAQKLMERISYVGLQPENGQIALESRVVLRLANGDEYEETVNQSHGTPSDPLSREELLAKFHECAEDALSEVQRDRVIELCERLDSLDTLGDIADVIGSKQMRPSTSTLAVQ